MGRRIRTNLSILEDLLTPKGAHKVKVAKIKEKQKQKQKHDKRAKHLCDLKPGKHVRIRDHVTELILACSRCQSHDLGF